MNGLSAINFVSKLELVTLPPPLLRKSITRCFIFRLLSSLKEDLKKTNTTLQAGNIVLIRTDRDQLSGQDFFERGTGMSKEATQWLIDQGIKVMGIDQWGWDLPLKHLVAEAKKSNNKELFWEGHLVGIDREYLQCHQIT